jgi:hypothetical protein
LGCCTYQEFAALTRAFFQAESFIRCIALPLYGKTQSSDRAVGVRPLIQLDTIKRHVLVSDKRLRDRFATVDLRLSVLLAEGSAGSLPGLHQRSLNTEAKKQPDRMRQHPG